MRLHVVAMVAALVLAPAAVRAQTSGSSGSTGGQSGGQRPAEIVRLSQGSVDAMIPLLQGESMGSNDLNTRLSARAMTKTLYLGNKNALYIAKLDAAEPTRLRAVKGQALQVRQANAALYRANASKLDAVLAKVHSDPGCDLCSAPPASPMNRAR